MNQMALFSPDPSAAWSVTDVTRYMRELLQSDHNLQDVWVSGEVSNVSQPRSGHLYFTLKDENASLKCVMWKPQVMRLRFAPRDGDAVEVHGKIDIYETGGQYQLYADQVQHAGQGRLYQEFLRLKAKLEAEGLFDPARKQEIPRWPARIGIVTSPTGAALQDMLNTLRRRYPLVEVVVAPSAVQGLDAPPQVQQAIRALLRQPAPDVILVARGGGSIEDLWAFNDEGVVRTIAASDVPVITGIGHETDFTLSDFAADLRAPTPTAAAERAVPDRDELRITLDEWNSALDRAAGNAFIRLQWLLNDLRGRLQHHTPQVRIENQFEKMAALHRRLDTAARYQVRMRRTHLAGVVKALVGLNPSGILARGYAIVTSAGGDIIRSTAQAEPGENLSIRVKDGTLGVKVESKDNV